MKIELTVLCIITTVRVYAQMQFVAPVPNSTMHNPNRNIIIRPGSLLDILSISPSLFTITGSLSGKHGFNIVLARDKKTIILNPTSSFAYGEKVDVVMKKGIRNAEGETYSAFSFSFFIHREYNDEEKQRISVAIADEPRSGPRDLLQQPQNSQSNSNPNYTIVVNTNPAPGQIFFENTAEAIPDVPHDWIIESNGDSIFSMQSADLGEDWKLNHNNYLTTTNSNDTYSMYDSNYVVIATFSATNGYNTNPHDFQIFPDGHYFLIAKDPKIVDMKQYDSSYQSKAVVIGNIIQELDSDNNLIFEWRTFDHIDIPETVHEDLAVKEIDPVHINSLEQDFDGNMIFSSRHLDQVNKIDLGTGDFIWRLGGKLNQFTFTNDTDQFNYQGDARRLSDGHLTLFNNNTYGFNRRAVAKEYQLDEVTKTATLVWSYSYPKMGINYLTSRGGGNVERLSNGNTLIDWGYLPAQKGFPNITELDSNNNIVWELRCNFDTAHEISYRAHRTVWKPCARPSDSKLVPTDITSTAATLNWNVATGAIKYGIQYRMQGQTSWKKVRIPSPSVLSYTLTGLKSNTTYEWRMISICNKTDRTLSNFTAIHSFTTSSAKASALFPGENQFSVDPNPASGIINIRWNQQNDNLEIIHFTIINSLGETVMEKKVVSKQGSNELSTDIWALSKGIYLIRGSHGKKHYELKWVKE